ncbi:MAG: TonB-dependent receptor [Deltaproteobacteria bacterium]|nr:TonB-dependent receptor [Deltaproteobacteria bacterium]MBW2399640.1 TonB-dependent receptor [Deltaproteobacteria bacterium]MBW2665930.1 TonB-dependent receptor [Deltaproteobacteria bacterium]
MQTLQCRCILSFLASVALVSLPAETRADASAADPIEELTVTATRTPKEITRVPAAVASLGKPVIQLGRKQVTIAESLQRIPGVFLQNRSNFAQDLRISIRGFGARSSFGIRGIRLVVDGIPATLPDGQAQVDNIDLGSADRIDVLRGPSSSLYGPSSGGVIQIESETGPEDPFLSARIAAGGYGYQKYQTKAGGRWGALDYMASLSYLDHDGYRRHAATENLLFNSRFGYAIDETSDLGLTLNVVHAPRADDPGALTAEQVENDRRQAAPRNLRFDAGESVDQQQFGLRYRKQFGERHAVEAVNYYVWRQFDNRLPFTDGGSVELNRFFAGGGLRYVHTAPVFAHDNRLMLGFEIDAQRDARKRYQNNDGDRGSLVFDQDEDVTGYGVYLQDEFQLLPNLELTVGVRYDRVVFDVDDHFGSDDGGRLHFDEWSPSAGLLFSPHPAINLFVNVSTGFETPTTTELANPDGSGGFNQDLEAQTSLGAELGVQGMLPGRLRYQVVGFHIEVEDELVPFEVPSMPGRDFYENAGSSKRSGVEVALAAQPCDGLTASLAYTFSHFEFEHFRTATDDFSGNRLPGVPRHQVWAELAYAHPIGLYAAWEVSYASDLYADNANRVTSDAFVVSNLRVGWVGRIGRWELGPFLGLDNLFNEKYADNVRLNANPEFGRYFEPAPGFNVYGGLSVGYHFGAR